MIYHRGASLSEYALLFCHAHKPWIKAGFVTVCCSVSMVSKNFMQPFLRSTKLLLSTHTHTLGLNFTNCHELNLWRLDVIIYGPYLKRTQLLCVIWRYRLWAACLCLSWSAVVFSRSIGVEFVTEHFSTCANFKFFASVRSIKFLIYGHKQASKQTYIHTHMSCNAITLVWGSLRPVPINSNTYCA